MLDRVSRARSLAGAVSLGVLAAVMATPATAQAQPAAGEGAEEVVVVTGIRASLRNSINVKRNLDVVAEVVSAEDIGKLPDLSIAESLARLPGLTAQRVDGRATRLSLRGLGPDFTTALLNGREQVSTNDNRGVEFDQYPAELLGSVNVYKTSQAGLLAQGIAGTVDMRTVRPLSRSGRTVAVNARIETNSLGAVNPDSDDLGYRLSGAYIDQFMDGTLGVALGVAYLDGAYQSEKLERYNMNGSEFTWNPAAPPPTASGPVRGQRGLKVMSQSNDIQRIGVVGILEFEPTDTFSVVVDAYYSDFQEERRQRGFETDIGQWNNSVINRSTAVLDGRDLVAATVSGGAHGLRSNEDTREATLSALGVRAEWDVSDRWQLGADVSFSKAERTDENLETFLRLVDGAGNTLRYDYSFDARNNALRLTVPAGYSDPARLRLGSPYGWGNGYLKIPSTVDELVAFRLDATREFDEGGAVRSMELGINYSERSKTREMVGGSEFSLALGSGNAAANLPAAAVAGLLDLGHGGAGRAVALNGKALLSSGALMRVRSSGPWIAPKNWTVEEAVWTAFARFNFETEFGGVPTTGNFGAQYVHTEQTSTGALAGFDSFFPVTASESYGEFLPSANVNFEISEDMYLRLAAARVLSRVQMTDLRVSREFGYDPALANSTNPNNSPWSSSGGNPFLRPWVSRNFDISFEHYFGRGAYWSFALFQKNLESYVRPGGTRVPIDFTGVVLPTRIPPLPEPTLRTGFATAPANGTGGTLKGLEFSLSLPFETFSEALDGFGVTMNVGRNFSDVEYSPAAFGNTAVEGRTELPGFSKLTGNITAYYENNGWQARISGRYRSEALQELVGFGADFEYKINLEETIWDAQVGYTFQDGMLEGLGITFQAANLTNEPWITGTQNPFRWLDSNTHGTTYSLGVSYSF
jgi:iron complex outermembrane recepter protein